LGRGQLNLKVDELLANIRKSVDSDIEGLSGGTHTQTRGTLMRGALREMRVSMGVEPMPAPQAPARVESKPASKEISDLRSRIKSKMAAMEKDIVADAIRTTKAPEPAMRAVQQRSDFSGILTTPTQPRREAMNPHLRPSYAEEEPDDLRYTEPQQESWSQRQAYQPEPEPYEPPHDPYAYGYEEQQAYAPNYPPPAPIVSPQTQSHAENAFQQLSDAILARATGDRSLEDMTREMLRNMLKTWLDANLPTIVEDMVREEIQRVARRGR
jgi:cell pole-organizing protein PopZ